MGERERGIGAPSRGERIVLYALLASASVAAATNVVGAVAIAVSATLGNRVDVSLISGYELPGAGIVDWVSFPEAIVRADLAGNTRVLLATADTVASLTAAAIAISFAFLCWRILNGQGFSVALTNAVAFAGASLSIGGLLSQGLGGFARMLAAEEVQNDVGAPVRVAFVFDGLPIAAGFAILTIAILLKLGERMKSRVIELEQETRGLV